MVKVFKQFDELNDDVTWWKVDKNGKLWQNGGSEGEASRLDDDNDEEENENQFIEL